MPLINSVVQGIYVDADFATGVVLRTEDTHRQIKENTYIHLIVPTLLTLYYLSYVCENELHYH